MMRRSDREITDREAIDDIIHRCLVCRLGLSDDGQPYVIPLSFGYDGEALYFHAATEGRKLDILKKNNRVCFEFDIPTHIVTADQACSWGMAYESVIGFGRAEIIRDVDSKRPALGCIMQHYGGPQEDFPEPMLARTLVIRVLIESVSGKARR
jgi:uncharacterized protein